MSSAEPIYASRVLKLPLVTPDGDAVGRVDDLVIGPPTGETAPILLGLVAQVGRRRIFVSASRVKHFETSGVVLTSTALDLNPFKGRTGELLLTSLLDRPLRGEKVLDLSMRPRTSLYGRFGVAEVMLGRRRALGFSARMRRVPWEEVAELFDVGEAAAELVKLRSLHPSETARAMQDLSDDQREELVDAMQDEDLADVLEELPEEDQAEILLAMEPERAAQVLEEMEPDDAADLLSELNAEDQSRLLEAMDPEEADPLRRLLIYEGHTAGGLMTPEPIILLPESTVAESLARIRAEEVPAAIASCVFVTQPPTQPPTGIYLGALSFQRLLREPPSTRLADLVDGQPEAVAPDLPEIQVAERLAAYNLLALPVCDESGFLLGAVTVDDVLDRTLPVGWRTHQ
jgi:flagellar motility protein MotE (MotC chaperone)